MPDVPRYTREQVRHRQRIAAAILLLAGLVVLGSCTVAVVRMASGDDAARRPAPSAGASGGAPGAGAPAVSVPPTPADAPALSQLPRGQSLASDEVLGIDVSSHQGTIDWTRVRRAGVSAAYIKASEGVGHVDPAFTQNWSGAAGAGIARGAYHYFTLCSPGAAQAAEFLRVVPPDARALPPAVDLELAGGCDQRPDADAAAAQVRAFVDAVEKAWGRRVMVYSSWQWRERYALPPGEHPAWLTRHEGRPNAAWQVWQVRFDARIDGIDHDVDLDVLRPAALNQAAKIASARRA